MDAFARHLAGLSNRDGGRDGTAIVTGLVASRDKVTVNLYGHTVTLRKARNYVPSVGDVVTVVGDGNTAVVFDALGPNAADASAGGSGAPSVPPPEPGRDQVLSGSQPFVAAGSMTWRPDGGWMTWESNLYQGTGYGYGPHKGLWFHGTAPAATLAGATVTGCRVLVPRRNGGGSFGPAVVHVWWHSYASRPGGEPSMGGGSADITLARGKSDWCELPASVGQTLVDGSARGLGINGDPYLVVDGVDMRSDSGTIVIDWRRADG